MSQDKFLNAFKDTKEIKNENQDDDEIIRDLRFLYEPKENYYGSKKTKGAFGGIMSNTKAMEILMKQRLLKVILIR